MPAIEELHTLVTGSQEACDPDGSILRDLVAFLRHRLREWEPTIGEKHLAFDTAVKLLLTVALDEYWRYGAVGYEQKGVKG